MWQNVRNAMTTDWSHETCGATREKPSKVLCTTFLQPFFFVLRNFIKNVVTIQATNNIKSICCVKGHGGKQEVTFPSGRKLKKRSAIVTTCLIDFFKTSAEKWMSMLQTDSEPLN